MRTPRNQKTEDQSIHIGKITDLNLVVEEGKEEAMDPFL